MNADTPLSGNHELRRLADTCPSLKNPNCISSNTLRKYLATVSQILDMTDKEVEMLAFHLGHIVKTHKENYRLSHSTRELTAVAQLLLTVEQGDLNKWKGKKPSEIELEGKFPRELQTMRKKKKKMMMMMKNKEIVLRKRWRKFRLGSNVRPRDAGQKRKTVH